MKAQALKFNHIVETLYNLPLEERLEINTLLEHNIADSRRNEIANNFRQSQDELKSGKLKDLWSFSIENDLRVVYFFTKDKPKRAVFVDIGTHDEVY